MTDWRNSYQIRPEPVSKYEFVLHDQAPTTNSPAKLFHQKDILINTIHDGDIIPEYFWNALSKDPDKRKKEVQRVEDYYALERDWGANLVAEAIVDGLNQRGYASPGYFKINIARVLMDYGRFPGNTPPGAVHLDRFAINYPFSHLLGYEQKKYLFEAYYDDLSGIFENLVSSKKLKIAIHTYDRFNKTGTERPLMSILTRPLAYQTKSAMPHDFFDPMYPAVLCEYTADRKLTYRLSLMLEKAGYDIAHNYPYNLPDGSIEVRAQVWFFFRYLQTQFQEAFPETCLNPSYKQVWDMLLDTNLRSTESENLRSYMHMFRKAPKGEEIAYQRAHQAYRHIRSFLERDNRKLVTDYRFSPDRTSSIGIEVRKDYVWDFADKECRIPIGPKPENAQKVGQLIAEALMLYIETDIDFTFL